MLTDKEIDALVNFIEQLRLGYLWQYGSEPKYIKLPIWLYKALQAHGNAYTDINNATHICGLIICETPRIEHLGEIELF